jgi:hypothetical protein
MADDGRCRCTQMNGAEIEKVVRGAIGDSWNTTNEHGADLREALVRPRLIKVIQRMSHGDKFHDDVFDAWLVLLEKPDSCGGYRIIADINGRTFGLASEGRASDDHLVLCGWYGDFWAAFEAM